MKQLQFTSAAGVSVTISPGISVRRRMSGVPQYSVVHPHSVEIYRLLRAAEPCNWWPAHTTPHEQTSDDLMRTLHGIEGGLARRVKEGDILVLQPGTPHWFSSIDGDSITYMESRVG